MLLHTYGITKEKFYLEVMVMGGSLHDIKEILWHCPTEFPFMVIYNSSIHVKIQLWEAKKFSPQKMNFKMNEFSNKRWTLKWMFFLFFFFECSFIVQNADFGRKISRDRHKMLNSWVWKIVSCSWKQSIMLYIKGKKLTFSWGSLIRLHA